MSVTLESLSAQITSLEAKIATMSVAKMPKEPKAKKPKDPDAPKKEATWWIKRTQHVREILKPLIEKHNASAEKKLAGTVPVRVASMLKEAGLLTEEKEPSDESIAEYFETFLADPPEPKMPALREAAAAKKTGSVASESSSGEKVKKPRAEMTEEQKKAKREKAAATRAANKAAKSEEAPKEAEKPKEDAKPKEAAKSEETVTAYEWEGDIGKGMKTYERVDYDGHAYIYTLADSAYLGVWEPETKKLNKKIPDFQEE